MTPFEHHIVTKHFFRPSDKEGYEICDCGTYRSTELTPRDQLYKNNYWNGNSRCRLADQVHNLTENTICGVSKINKVLQKIAYVNLRGTILEIACAPGIFAKTAMGMGYQVTGIEPDPRYNDEIKEIAGRGLRLINGYFPECLGVKERFNFIVGMDVFEHIEDYDAFIQACYNALSTHGRLILMSPVILADGKFRHIDFLPEEHCWIFSETYLRDYLKTYFSNVEFDRWKIGHEIIICDK